MKFLGLIFRNMLHSRRRTVLTIGSISVALFLFCTLRTAITAINSGVETADAARLVVRQKASLVFPLPLAYRERIRSVEGVNGITWANWFGGDYQNARNFFPKFAVDADTYLEMYPEMDLPADQKAAFKAERTACIVGTELVKKYGWKLGDTVPIIGTIYPNPDGEWHFIVRGIYTPRNSGVDAKSMYFHWDYLNEVIGDRGQVGFYVVRLGDPARAAGVAEAIDAKFANSAAETRTETEKAFQMGFVSMWGNIGFLVSVIGAAVIFAILLVTFNTMMMAARERTSEIAILKTLGFSDGLVLLLVVGEAILIALIGGALGCGGAWALYTVSGFNGGGFLPNFIVKLSTLGMGILIALAMGFLSGLLPAVQAARLRIAEALRQVT